MIKVANLTHYYGNDLALKDINLEINKGEFVSITGESGSGKSTLLSIISTLLKPSLGIIEINNTKIHDIKDIDNFRKYNIGFVFQFHYLLDYLTLKENTELAFGEKLSNKHIELAKRLGVYEKLNYLPNQISGGQRQRGAILRALANNPKIIFADEPTGNLDSKNSLKVFELFKELSSNGITIVVATHNEKLAKYANKIVEIEDGQISNIH